MATISIADNDARIQHSIGSGGNVANTTTFTIDFPFFDLDDINVIITDSLGNDTTLTRGTGTNTFAVTGTAVDDGFSGGNITLGSVYTSVTVTVFRDIPVTRTTDFATSGPFNIAALNTELDRIIAIQQELETDISRALILPATDPLAGIVFPNSTTRASKFLAFDASGNAIASSTGSWQGNWTASRTYAQGDIVKDTSTGSIYIANQAHTSSGSQPLTTNTDSAKWDQMVDISTVTTAETNAANSATAASTSATNAATSKTAAETAKTAAETAKTAAESARDATLLAYDNFDDRYLGVFSSDPTVDNDGDALVAGSLYFNSTDGNMKVYTGSAWVVAYVSGAGFLATTGGTMSGDITMSGANIISASNASVNIVPNGTGDVTLQADTVQVGDSNANATITTNGTGDLILNTNAGTNSGTITIADGANADIELNPNGTGKTVLKGNTNPGTLVFNCESNSHGQTVKSQPHSAGVTNTLTLPAGGNGELVSTVATQELTNKKIPDDENLSFGTDSDAFIKYDETTDDRLKIGGAVAEFEKAVIGKTDTDTTNTGSVTLDFDANQNFVLTLTGNVTLANPSTEKVGQSGFIVLIQDSTGGRTLSLGTDYETAGGSGITLSTAASTTDIVPYVVAASNRILLGAPQLAFS